MSKPIKCALAILVRAGYAMTVRLCKRYKYGSF